MAKLAHLIAYALQRTRPYLYLAVPLQMGWQVDKKKKSVEPLQVN